MKIFIYGFAGNMGRRYSAILEHLGHDWCGQEKGLKPSGLVADCDGVIVATPTSTHIEVIREIIDCGMPILCEKPISKDLKDLRRLMADCCLAGTRVQMVSQYDWLVDDESEGRTVYDYFKTGPDGLPWDCMQPIWHAKSGVELSSKSPIWTCAINGQALSINSMDAAYVREIEEWLVRPRNDIGRILEAHEKVARLEASWPKS